jgi:hypothetical protein
VYIIRPKLPYNLLRPLQSDCSHYCTPGPRVTQKYEEMLYLNMDHDDMDGQALPLTA